MKRGLPILLALLVACSQFRVRSDADPSADFTRLRTYAWLPLDQADPADQRVLDRYLDKRLRTAIDRELGAKGYAPAESGAPDFLLNYRLSTEPASSLRGSRGMPYGVGWIGWYGAEAVYVENYDAGTLYIAVIDGRSRRIVWLGAAQSRILSHASLEKRAKRVDAVAHQILAKFPPNAATATSAH
jgi:hypothetical protein